MHNTITPDVRKGNMALRTFFVVILLTVVSGTTWWITKSHYECNYRATGRLVAQLDSSLYRMNDVLKADVQQLLYRMHNRKQWADVSEKANNWRPRMEALSQTAAQIQLFFKRERITVQTADDQQTIRKVMYQLPESLKSFEEDLLQIVPENKKANLADTLKQFRNSNEITFGLMEGLPTAGRLAALTGMEHTLLQTADVIARFIDGQFGCELMIQ